MNRETFREELLGSETMSPHLRDKYRHDVKAMLEKKLTPGQRALWILLVFLGLLFVSVGGWNAIVSAGRIPMVGTLLFTLGAVGGLIEVVLSVVVLKRGSFHVIRDSNITTRVPYSIVLVAIIGLLIWGEEATDQLTAVQMVLYALVFLLMAVMFMIADRINQAEWKLREDLLRIELELAELREKMEEGKEGG